MDKIKKKFQNNTKLLGEYKTYFDKFKNIIGSYYEIEMRHLKSVLEQFTELLEEAEKTEMPTEKSKMIHSFKLIHQLSFLDVLSKDTKEQFIFFNPGNHRFTQEFSSTYILETSAMFDKVIILINNTLKRHRAFDAEIVSHLGDMIYNSFNFDNPLGSFVEIRESYHKYRNGISLYSFVVQKIIDTLFTQDKDRRVMAFKIMGLLEDDKNLELSKDQYEKKYVKLKNNPPLQSFGLIPKTDLLSLSEIVQLAFNQSVSGQMKEEDLTDIGNIKNLCIIVHRKVTTRATDYKLKNILQKSSYKHTTGINLELVDKFQTIDVMGNSKYDFKITTYGQDLNRAVSVLIIEMLNIGRYRIVTPWSSPNFILPKSSVVNYVDLIQKKNVGKPTRSEYYNNIIIKKMMTNMFLERSINVRNLSEQSQVDEIKFLRNTVHTTLIIFYSDVLNKEHDNGKKIKNNKDLIKVINDERIKDIFTEILVKNYYNFLKRNSFIEEENSFVFTEVLSTFLAHLQVIVRNFVREIYANSEKFEPKESLYKKDYPIMYAEIKDVFESVVKATLGKIINDKSNIYQSLIYKTMMINI
jgi:hypothetical protein